MYKHMNAQKALNIKNLLETKEYIAEEKYDGVRFIYDKGAMYTRNGKDKAMYIPEITKIFTNVPAVLDMEVYIKNGTSKDMQSIIGTKEPCAHTKVSYKVFDVIYAYGTDLSNKELLKRRRILEELSKKYNFDITTIFNENIYSIYEDIIENHGEGIMLKNIHSYYQSGKRPCNTWYKVKKHDNEDVIITGYIPGTGRNKNKVGSLLFEKDGRTGSCSGFSDDDREIITENIDNLIGTTMEISYMEKTDIAYRHPVFKLLRNDK